MKMIRYYTQKTPGFPGFHQKTRADQEISNVVGYMINIQKFFTPTMKYHKGIKNKTITLKHTTLNTQNKPDQKVNVTDAETHKTDAGSGR